MLLNVFGTQEALDEMSAVHPIARIGRPEEIADAVAWLFSDNKLLQNVRDEKWRVGLENLDLSNGCDV